MDELRCAKCCGMLNKENGIVICEACSQVYRIDQGIYDFRIRAEGRHSNLAGSDDPVESTEMESLIRGMTDTNWTSTVRRFLAGLTHGNLNDWIDELTVNSRYAWKLLLNLRPDHNLLELGCGLGNLSSNLAPHVRKIYAMDLAYRGLQFSQKRFSIFNKSDDIQLIAAGDGPYLPFADNSLDSVVLSGVIEWIGVGDTSSFENGSKLRRLSNMFTRQYGRHGPRALQLRFIKEIRRVLKPSGQLFIGAQNRLSAEYFRTERDHHSGLRYGSLLPRPVANLYSIFTRQRPYRTYTYSIPGYRKLLAEAQFSDVEFFGLFNGLDDLNRIVPAKVPSKTWSVKRPKQLKQRIKETNYFVPAYGILAGSAGAMGSRLQDRIFSEIEAGMSQPPGSLRVLDYRITRKEKIIIFADVGDYPVIIRMPLADGSQRSEGRNFEMLQYLHPRLTDTVRCPAPLLRGNKDHIGYFVEERLSGTTLRHWKAERGRENAATLVRQCLTELQESSTSGRQVLEGALYQHVVTDLIQQVVTMVDDVELGRRLTDYFAEQLKGKEVVIGACHGDFGSDNLMVSEGRITGIIDWEAGSRNAAIVTDAINYLITAELAATGGDLASVVRRVATLDWAVPVELELLKTTYDRFKIDQSLHEPFAYLAWLSQVATVPSPFFVFNVQRIQQSIHNVAETICHRQSP